MTHTPETTPEKKKRRSRLWHLLWVAPVALALLAAGAAWAGHGALVRWALAPFGSEGVHGLTIQPGMSARAIAAQLAGEGLVSDEMRLLVWLRLKGRAGSLQAGDYQIETPVTPESLVGRLGHGSFTRRLTIPEGWTARQIAARLEAEGWIAHEEDWRALVAEPLKVDALGPPVAEGSEGYCFPDTYDFEKGVTARQIHERMLEEFRRQWRLSQPEQREEASESLSIREVIILASMVQREARLEEEMPQIASVYLNRLRRGMKMQCCATVRYAMGEMWDRPLTYADLKIDSPYNTYLHRGLPPSPIANPGRAAIEAVLRPAQTDYLFYVYRGEGQHIFSRTHREHQRAIRLARRGNPQAEVTGQRGE